MVNQEALGKTKELWSAYVATGKKVVDHGHEYDATVFDQMRRDAIKDIKVMIDEYLTWF